MTKKDKLYTANRWNRNLFAYGGIEYPTFQMDTPRPLNDATMQKVKEYESSLYDTTAAPKKGWSKNTWNAVGGAAANAAPRRLYDDLDPVYHLAGGRESGVGNAMNETGVGLFKTGASSGNPWLMLAGAGAKIGGGLVNLGWGVKKNQARIDRIEDNTSRMNTTAKSFNGTDSTSDILHASGNMSNLTGYGTGDLMTPGLFNKGKTRRKEQNYFTQEANAYAAQNHGLASAVGDNMQSVGYDAMKNYGAFGGLFDMGGDGAIDYGFMSDYLTMKNRQVNKERTLGMSGVPSLFAIGGDIQTHGSDFSTGLTRIDTGGSHEENPHEGVQVGVDREGIPNLVEEGETIFNDYVYSTRILADAETKRSFHLPKKRDISFAEISKKLEKEASERPNDPISQAGLKAQMAELAEHQERQKQEMEATKAKAAFAALSPEEQTAIMQQRAVQEQQVQEGVMQQQAIAEQQALGKNMGNQGGISSNLMQADGSEALLGQEPHMSCFGGKINRFDHGGSMKERLYRAMGWHTDKEFYKWANKHKLHGYTDWGTDNNPFADGATDEDWQDMLKDPSFVAALGDKPGLADAIKRGYDFGYYQPSSEGKATIQSINRGNWKATDGKGWRGSDDLAFIQATKGLTDAQIDALSTEELATLMKNTDAYKNTSKWLEDADNALLYLNTLLNDPDTPEVAKQHARKFIKDGKWKDGFTYSYDPVFGKVRDSAPGTYWHSVLEANRDNITKNLLYDRDAEVWREIYGDPDSSWNLSGAYNWNDKATGSNNTYNYYMEPGNIYHAVEGDGDYLPEDQGQWNGVGAEVRRETLPNGDVVVYHSADGSMTNQNDVETDDIVPNLRNEKLRYAGLFGPAIGLGLQAAGIGKPDYAGLDAALATANRGAYVPQVDYIDGYLKYTPQSDWELDNRRTAKARATDRALLNTSSPFGNKMTGLLANGYNDMLGTGENHLTIQQYNDKMRKDVLDEYKDTQKWNRTAFNQNEQAKADVLNRDRQYRAGLQAQIASQKMDADASWYNGLYGNLSGLFKGIGDLGTENYRMNRIAEMAARGDFGTATDKTYGFENYLTTDTKKRKSRSNGGKIKRGLTY